MALGGASGAAAGAVRAGRAFVEILSNDNALRRGLDTARRRLQAFGSSLRGIGTGALGLSAPLLGGLAAAVNTLGDLTSLKNVGDAFGLAAEEATGFFGIMRAAGSDTRDATEGLVTLSQRVTDALAGRGEEAVQLFQDLGVSAQEFAGLNPAQQFYRLHEALQGVADPAKRVQLLLKAVGEDTGKNMINTLAMTTEQLREQGRSFALSGEELGAAKEATAAYSRATASLSRVWQQVAVSMAPTIAELSQAVLPFLQSGAELVKQNRALFAGLALAGVVLAGAGAGLIGLGAAASGAAAALALVKGALGVLLSPVGLIAAALAGLGYLFFTQTDLGQEWASGLSAYFAETAANAAAAFGAIKNAVAAGRLDLAWAVALAALDVEWQRLIVQLQEGWNGFKGFFVDGWHDAVLLVQLAFVDLVTFIKQQLGEVLTRGLEVLSKLNKATGGMAFGLVGGDLIEAAKAVAEGNPDQIRNQIIQDAQRGQAERDQARAADLAGAQAALAGARDALAAAIAEARAVAGAAAGGGPERPPPKLPPELKAFSLGASAGAFQGPFKQMLGGNSIDQKQLAAVEKANDLLADIKEGIDKLKGVFV